VFSSLYASWIQAIIGANFSYTKQLKIIGIALKTPKNRGKTNQFHVTK